MADGNWVIDTRCDLNPKHKIKSVMYMGKLKHDPGWHYLCPDCYQNFGAGIGPGLGMRFERVKRDSNIFRKTNG